MEPLISLIIPVYNVEDYLDECIESIVNQTYKNLEIILVDDGSPDNCPKICDMWAKKDLRIKVIHKINAGAAAARNTGLEVANGDYIGFVDSDDFIAENMFEKMLDCLMKTKNKMCCCGIKRVNLDGTISEFTNFPYCSLDIISAINSLFYGEIDTAVWSKLFEKSVFDGIRFPDGETNEEYPILIPLIYNSNGITITGESYYYYRMREGSVTNSSFMQESSSALVYKNLGIIYEQLLNFNLSCKKSYRFFASNNAYHTALLMEKNYDKLSSKIREDYKVYRRIMFKGFFSYVFSKFSNIRDKILYIFVLFRLLRPFYKLFYKNHLKN